MHCHNPKSQILSETRKHPSFGNSVLKGNLIDRKRNSVHNQNRWRHLGISYAHSKLKQGKYAHQVETTPSSETQGQIVGPKTKIKTGPYWAEKFSAQSGASIRSAVWNWCVKSLSPGARIFLSYFCSSNFFPPVLIFVFGPTICPWVSEDEKPQKTKTETTTATTEQTKEHL